MQNLQLTVEHLCKYLRLTSVFFLFALATGWLSNALLPSTERLPTAAHTTPSLHAKHEPHVTN